MGEPETAPLPDRVVVDARMLPQSFSFEVNNLSGRERVRILVTPANVVVVPLDKAGVVVVRHEADLLALGFFSNRKAVPSSQSAHLLLAQIAQGEQGARELFLAQTEQKIGLVLIRITSLEKHVPASFGVPGDPRVMPRCHVRGSHFIGCLQEMIELHVGVTQHAGRGRHAPEVAFYEWAHHFSFEFALKVDHIVGKAKASGHAASIVQVVDGATAASALLFSRGAVSPLVPQLHREPYQVVPLFLEDGRGRRAVHSSAHGHRNPARLAHGSNSCGIHRMHLRTR